ncbi:hypothetical protein GGS23DRAFT_618470 [Durotheca rogersii]|uniref:uncharacterized protein n=1 Tax=Durotheca rogersii TaxID=419775 RepID=UPI0022209859|nr:uncharacterized protein GGS23DRAFT_618470 [Durotheca rogersii]KAI5865432.1 hypothetical protein GGS23DRAFT_618470 [Durotheca rogersii]
MRPLGRRTAIAVFAVAVSAHPAPAPTETAQEAPCVTGTPVVTAGYTIDGYAPALPTARFESGYQPEPAWADDHVVGTYTFGVPSPVAEGFAYAQFKCQYYCRSSPAASFFVGYVGSRSGSLCTCYDELLDTEKFVAYNESLVGAWNHICPAKSLD